MLAIALARTAWLGLQAIGERIGRPAQDHAPPAMQICQMTLRCKASTSSISTQVHTQCIAAHAMPTWWGNDGGADHGKPDQLVSTASSDSAGKDSTEPG